MNRKLGGAAGVGVGLIASALAALGAPSGVWIIIGLLGSALLVYAFVVGEPEQGAPRVPSELRSPLPGRLNKDQVFLSESPFELMRPFRDHSDVEARRLVSVNIGNWIEAEGYVSEPTLFDTQLGQDIALSRRPWAPPCLFLSFSDRDYSRRRLAPGDKVRAIGRVWQIAPWTVVLRNCELV